VPRVGQHGQASLTKRLQDDLTQFKSMVEGGTLGGRRLPATTTKRPMPGASSKELKPNPAAVAARIRNRNPHPGVGWGTSAAEQSNASRVDLPRHDFAAGAGTNVDITSAPGITSEHDLDDVLPPGRRIAKSGQISGGAAGSAPMGGRTTHKDAWGDGMINEEDRGSGGV
jgi:hypothetical protein